MKNSTHINSDKSTSQEYLLAHLQDPIDKLFAHGLHIDFSGTKLFWRDFSPLKTCFENAMSLFTPILEDFIISASTEALEFIKDPVLIEQIKLFCLQERNHARAHESFNELLRSQGFEVEKYLNKSKQLIERLRTRSLLERLEACVLYEALIAMSSKLYCQSVDKEHFDAAPRQLIIWHAIEELEHRCISYQIYCQLAGKYNPSFFKTLLISAATFMLIIGITFHALWRKKSFFRFRLIKDLYWLFQQPILHFMIAWCRFLKKGYNPKNDFNQYLINKAISSYEQHYHLNK